MTRVLLTGGSGFIAAHVLDILLAHGHSVVTTVRSQGKVDKIKEGYKNVAKDRLDFAIVEDISKENAFDEAVKSNPPFEAVIHTASPFHFNATDVQKELLDPAVIGTTGILKSVQKSAPAVKTIAITSSFAAMLDSSQCNRPGYKYSEQDWNPVKPEEATANAMIGYRASKTFAEKAAWDFLDNEKPSFSIITLCPPIVFGPVMHHLSSLDSLNTSNQRIRDMIQGKYKNELPPNMVSIWVDVHDAALAHVKAIETPAAANKRFFVTAGHYSNQEIAKAIRESFPEYRDVLPEGIGGGEFPPDGYFGYDNSRAKEILGIEFRSLNDSIVDTVRTLKEIGR